MKQKSKIDIFFDFFLLEFLNQARSNQENDPGNVLSTRDLTIKHVHHTQFRKISIFEKFQFSKIFKVLNFFRFFEPGLGRIAKTTSDSVSESKKMIQNDMLHAYIRHIFKKNRKNRYRSIDTEF